MAERRGPHAIWQGNHLLLPNPTSTATAAPQGSGPPHIRSTGCGKRLGGDNSPSLNTYYVPSKIPDTSYFLMLTTTINSDDDSSILGMKKLSP